MTMILQWKEVWLWVIIEADYESDYEPQMLIVHKITNYSLLWGNRQST